jgi:hypothetical protein
MTTKLAPTDLEPAAPEGFTPVTDFRFEWTDTQAGDRAAALAELAAKNKPSSKSVWAAAVDSESLTKRLIAGAVQDRDTFDPNWKLTPEWAKEQANIRGIPQEYLGPLSTATSEAHASHVLDAIQTELRSRQTLASAGWEGVGAAMLTSVLDPVQLGANFTPAGVASWMTRGGAIKAAVKGGLVAGGTNAALEAGLAASQYTRTPEDIFLAGLMGLSLGAPVGALAGHFAKTAKDAWTATTLRKAAREGNPLTPTGERTLALSSAPYEAPPITGDLMPRQTGVVPVPDRPALERPAIDGEASVVADAQALPDQPRLTGPDGQPKEPILDGAVQEPPASTIGGQAAKVDTPEVPPKPETFAPGDEVEWKSKKGETQTGKVIEVLDNGHYMIEDSAGNIRSFNPNKVADDVSEHQGFGPGSIGAAQLGHIDEPTSAFMHFTVPGLGWKIPLRFDSYAYFQKTDNPIMQRIGNLLLTDNVGKTVERGADGQRIFGANRVTAEDYSALEMKRFHTEAHGYWDDAWNKFKERNGITRMRESEHERAFFEDITKAGRGDATVAARNPEAAEAARNLAAVRKKALEQMKRLGVDGVEEIAENVNYVMRKFDWENLAHHLADPEMRPRVHQLITEAIQKARPSMLPKDAERIAKAMVERLRKIPTDRENVGFLTDAGRARTAEMLRGSSLDDTEVEDILDWVFGHPAKKKEGDSPRLKHRTLLDENHSITWLDDAGKEHTLAFSDLLENDVRKLDQQYYRQTSGLIGLAKVGIRSRADMDALLEEAREHALANGVHHDVINRQQEAARKVMRHILGQPMYEGFGADWERGIRALRNVNFITYMAQAAFAQVAEMGQVLGLKTVMAMRTNMSAFEEVVQQAQKGTMDGQLIRDLRAMGIVAEESALRKPIANDGGANPFLTKADNVAAKGAWWVSRASGMNAITEFQRNTLSKLYTQRLLNIASGAEKMDDKLLQRLATNGLEGDELESVLAQMRKHSVVDEGTNNLVHIDYDAWERSSQRTFDLFRLAVYREGHRGIQEISLGATPLWMHHTLGKVLFQLRSFVMNAWTKQTLYGLNHGGVFDLHNFTVWSSSMAFGALAYSAQTALNYATNEKEREKRLDPLEIAKAGFQRAGFASLIPMAVDSTLGFAVGDPFFKYGRSTGLGSNMLGGVPTVATVGKVLNTASAVTQSGLTDDHLWTQKDFANAAGLLPNYYGLKTLINTYQQDMPKRNFLRLSEQ